MTGYILSKGKYLAFYNLVLALIIPSSSKNCLKQISLLLFDNAFFDQACNQDIFRAGVESNKLGHQFLITTKQEQYISLRKHSWVERSSGMLFNKHARNMINIDCRYLLHLKYIQIILSPNSLLRKAIFNLCIPDVVLSASRIQWTILLLSAATCVCWEKRLN